MFPSVKFSSSQTPGWFLLLDSNCFSSFRVFPQFLISLLETHVSVKNDESGKIPGCCLVQVRKIFWFSQFTWFRFKIDLYSFEQRVQVSCCALSSLLFPIFARDAKQRSQSQGVNVTGPSPGMWYWCHSLQLQARLCLGWAITRL